MQSELLTLIFDILIIVFGTTVIKNALMQIYAEIGVKELGGYWSDSWRKVTPHQIFFMLGVMAVLIRIWYLMLR